MRDAARHLVESGEHRDRILDFVGKCRLSTEQAEQYNKDEKLSEADAAQSRLRL
jgi:hypothetical protein